MTMIKIGEWNDLIVKREKEFGVYLVAFVDFFEER